MTKTFVSPYQIITDKIVAALEKGVASWVKPWKSKNAVSVSAMPINWTTGAAYRGINTVMLYCASIDNGWDVPAFATFKQIAAAGGTVKKGSKGEHVYFMSKIEREPKTEEEAAKVNENGKYEQFILKGYTVFNIAQVEGIELDIQGIAKPSELPADVTDLCKLIDVKLTHGGDKAFFRPIGDVINMPTPEAFETLAHYKATAFHEATHATGATHRLNRDQSGSFGSKNYAFEELVAELGAAFLCMEFGVEGNLRHPEYIASWLKVMKEDNRAFYRAAAQAQKAMDWLKDRAGTATSAEEEDMKEAA